MTENQTKPNFWTTLPGILTGVAALLTAVVAAWVTLRPHKPEPPPKEVHESTGPQTDRNQGQRGSEVSIQPSPVNKPHATIITGNDKFVVDTDSLTWMMREKIDVGSGEFGSGESIPFDMIKAINVLDVRDLKTTVQISRTDGQTTVGSVPGGSASPTTFEGYTDRGTKVTVRIGEVKQIVIEH